MPAIPYILLDRKNDPLARGTLECPPDAPKLYVRVPEEQIESLAAAEILQLIAVSRDQPSLLGRVVGFHRNVLILERSESLASCVRQNFRVDIRFDTYIYPLTGGWQGRRYIISNDLSSGGISFFCRDLLTVGEQFEVVIPITAQPLILRCELLRVLRVEPDGRALYSAKFIEMCSDEETMTREAVYSAQLRGRSAPQTRAASRSK